MSDKEKKYSYQDCWNYAFSLRENIDIEEIKNDVISLCRTIPKHFWLNFSNKSLFHSDYSKVCYNLERYIKKSYPIPYLTNKTSFYGLTFYIEEGVFIPQKDTEILVEKTLEITDKYWKKKESLKVLDIGTGCGNIAISLAKSRKKWIFTSIDINEKALRVAMNNSVIHQIKNIEFIQSNLFDNIISKDFSIVISNPPYVSDMEYKNISLAAKEQPREALVAKNDGYFFYQEIFRKVHAFLTERFLLVVEIGYQQREKVIKLVIEYFPEAKVSIFPDYEGSSRIIAIEKVC